MEQHPYLMSSKMLPQEISAQFSVEGVPDIVLQPRGILSEDPEENPYFSTWSHVYVWYCSSDSHLGEAAAGGPSASPL